WFVCLGPLAAVLIAIALAVLSADTVSQGLVRRVSSAMHWVAWVPTRLFSLTLFLVLREDKTPIRQWWVTVKLAEQGVPEVMLATLRLVWSQRAQPHDLRQPGSAAVVWPCEDFTSMHAALKKVLLLWLGGVALLSILFY
ncbi:MAG: hypothetical protein P8104_07415, partial [Gammaproteobacteria bacterium]